MHRLALLIGITSGCTLYFDDHGPQTCTSNDVTFEARDPATLACETFSEPGGCAPGCECPNEPVGVVGIVAEPTWGSCTSACDGLDETTCLASDSCRVGRDWAAYYSSSGPSFIACYALDQVSDHTNPGVCAGRDAQDCSRHAECSGLYQQLLTDCAGCTDAFEYKECIPKHQVAGSCSGPVACELRCRARTAPRRASRAIATPARASPTRSVRSPDRCDHAR